MCICTCMYVWKWFASIASGTQSIILFPENTNDLEILSCAEHQMGETTLLSMFSILWDWYKSKWEATKDVTGC